MSAKGGDLLNRTVDNYFRRGNREELNLGATRESDGSDADADRTPKEDRMDIDESTSTGRATRGKLAQLHDFAGGKVDQNLGIDFIFQDCGNSRRKEFSSSPMSLQHGRVDRSVPTLTLRRLHP